MRWLMVRWLMMRRLMMLVVLLLVLRVLLMLLLLRRLRMHSRWPRRHSLALPGASGRGRSLLWALLGPL